MLKIENTGIFGWDAAIRGARNPMNSWDKSDSDWVFNMNPVVDEGFTFKIGPNDLNLLKSLSKAGPDHGKFLRMINVSCDITAPLYWWKQFDAYKIGTVTNSCSTMHKVHAKEFELDDFSHEHVVYFGLEDTAPLRVFESTVECLNEARDKFLETKDKLYWWQIIQLLPSSYNQKRTVQFNYAVLKSMYHARRNHKLDEWHVLCDWCKELPYFEEICVI